MKKHICTIIALTVFAASAFASQIPDLLVNMNIPFTFQAGGCTLPAGTYTVAEPIYGFLLVRGPKRAIFVPAAALLVDTDSAGRSAFRFTHAGDKYILQEGHSEK